MDRSRSRSPYPSDPRLRRNRNHRHESSREMKREPRDTNHIKWEAKDEPESASNHYRIPKVKNEIKEEPRENRYDGLSEAQSHRAIIDHSPSHCRHFEDLYSPHHRGRHRRSPSPRRGRSHRSPSYSRSRSLSPHRKMSRIEIKKELGVTAEMLHEMESNGFWNWREEDEERECPVCKVSMTGAEPWYAHLDGRKHRNAMKKFGFVIKPPEKPDENEVEQELLAQLSDSEQPKAEKTTTGIQYRCPICDIPVNDLTVYKSHVNGQKHKKRKRTLLKTVGLGLTDDICPACRLSLKDACSSCVASGNECSVAVGRCNHKIHRCCMYMPTLYGNCPLCPNKFEMTSEEFYDAQYVNLENDDLKEVKKEC